VDISSIMKSILYFLSGEEGSLKRKTVRSISWVAITGIVTNILLLVRGVILARILTPEVFGLMSICLVVIRGFEVFTETGFYTALIQRKEDYNDAKDTAFTLMVIRGVILTIITILISPLVAIYYEERILEITLKVIALSFIFDGFINVNTVCLQRELNFKRLSYLEQTQSLFNFVIVIILAYFFKSLWALVLGHVIAGFTGCILSYVIVPGRLRFRINDIIAKQLFTYGIFITGLSIVVFITTEINNIIIGKILGMEALGYYVLAYTLANLPATHISKVISRVIFPAYSALQDNRIALRELFQKTLTLISYITIPAAAGLAVLAPEIVRLVYGDKWTPAANSLVILSMFGCIRALGSIQGYLYNAIGKPRITFYMNAAKLIMILVIIYPLTRKYGLEGASLAITIPITIQYVVELFILRIVIDLSIRKIVNILIVTASYSGIMCLVILFVKENMRTVNVIDLISLIILGVAVYLFLSRNELSENIRIMKSSIG